MDLNNVMLFPLYHMEVLCHQSTRKLVTSKCFIDINEVYFASLKQLAHEMMLLGISYNSPTYSLGL